MQGEGRSRPRKQTRQDVLNGLRAGYSYRRPYSLDGGRCVGVESLEPIGYDQKCTQVLHTCVISGDEEDKVNIGTEELDDGLNDLIGNGLLWVRF